MLIIRAGQENQRICAALQAPHSPPSSEGRPHRGQMFALILWLNPDDLGMGHGTDMDTPVFPDQAKLDGKGHRSLPHKVCILGTGER